MTFTDDEVARWSSAAAPAPTVSAAPRALHSVFGGADRYHAASAARLSELALRALRRHGKDPGTFARVLGLPPTLAEPVWDHTERLLARGAVQEQWIDFEDGFGPRPDAEEDSHAVRTGAELAAALAVGGAAPRVGLRIRALSGPTAGRALRTLALFFGALAEAGGARDRVVPVCLPKVTGPAEVSALSEALDRVRERCGVAACVEVMIEVPSALAALRAIVGAGPVTAAHLGAYDLTAACGVPAADQALDHPLCDHARAAMQLALAGTAARVVDGATTLLPLGPHRGDTLPRAQLVDNDRVVHEAWRVHARNVRRAWAQGVPQGWDLHPAQIPVRFGVCAALLLESLPTVTARMRTFLDNAERATRTGAVFDDAATGLGLRNTLRLGHDAGIYTDADLATAGVLAPSG